MKVFAKKKVVDSRYFENEGKLECHCKLTIETVSKNHSIANMAISVSKKVDIKVNFAVLSLANFAAKYSH